MTPARLFQAGELVFSQSQPVKLAEAAPAPRFGHTAIVRRTHEQLAGLLGATREAASKTMADFSARKLVRQGRGRIIIPDTAALHTLARKNSMITASYHEDRGQLGETGQPVVGLTSGPPATVINRNG
jgi:hypothetical protein